MKVKLTAAQRKAGMDLRDVMKDIVPPARNHDEPDEDLNPQPRRYPVCSECKQAFVLRRALVFDAKARVIDMQWCWQRDCKHKKATAIVNEVSP